MTCVDLPWAAGGDARRSRRCRPCRRSRNASDFLPIFLSEGALGVTDLARLTGVPSRARTTLSKLEEAGLIEKTAGQKRILTDLGFHVANSL